MQLLRDALIKTAASVQYEAANELGRQLGVLDMPPEPFTEKQRRQSHMFGGEDVEGTTREDDVVAPHVVPPHLERRRNKAVAENRLSPVGQESYIRLPLTGALQSIFPWYRQRFSLACLGSASQPAANISEPPGEYRQTSD